MIIDYLLKALVWVIDLILSVVPAGPDLPAGVQTGFTFFLDQAADWDTILPLSEMFTALTFILTFEAALLTFFFARYIIKLVRGHG